MSEKSESEKLSSSSTSSSLLEREEEEDEGYQKPEEKWTSFLAQMIPAILIAGLGMIVAGLIYNKAGKTSFFMKIPESYMLAQPILGLKGNIEMTLVSRLSTSAHRNVQMLDWKFWLTQVSYNLCLLVVQAFALTAIACGLTIVTSSFAPEFPPANHIAVLCSSAVITTTVGAIVIGFFLGMLIYGAMCCKINPDNIATPLSASISDVFTLFLFMLIGNFQMDYTLWLPYMVNLSPIFIISLFIPFLIYIVTKNVDTKNTIVHGWPFLTLAVFLSSLGGFVLKCAQATFKQSAIFQPLLAGLSGNRAAIHCSRLSTSLHLSKEPRATFPLAEHCNPLNVFSCEGDQSKAAVILVLTSMPTQIFFLVILCLLYDPSMITPEFISCFMLVSMVQITLLIYLSHCAVGFFWRFNFDPDNCAIPVITSLADFSGTLFLFLMFLFLDCFSGNKFTES